MQPNKIVKNDPSSLLEERQNQTPTSTPSQLEEHGLTTTHQGNLAIKKSSPFQDEASLAVNGKKNASDQDVLLTEIEGVNRLISFLETGSPCLDSTLRSEGKLIILFPSFLFKILQSNKLLL